MAEATLKGFREQFPEFPTNKVEDSAIERVLEEALELHSLSKRATLFCAAHLLTLETDRAAGLNRRGEIASGGAGPLRASYRTQADNGWEAFFTRTEYGRRFLILEQRTPGFAIGARVVG